MGTVILLKLAYPGLKYELCEGCNIDAKFKSYYDNNLFHRYSKIYITDLHLNRDNLELIRNDIFLRKKVIIFDHNESAVRYNTYDFVNIMIKDENGDCCATSLIYDYLVKNNKIKSTKAIETFTNATRIYDTGKWEYGSNNELPRNLSLLFDIVGTHKYIDMMYNKLKLLLVFAFNLDEYEVINYRKNAIKEKVIEFVNTMKTKYLYGAKAGIIFISYEYRNEVAQYIRKSSLYDIDFLILVSLDKNAISLRNVNPDFNVLPIAEHIGGKGHFGAAGCYINEKNKQMIFNLIF